MTIATEEMTVVTAKLGLHGSIDDCSYHGSGDCSKSGSDNKVALNCRHQKVIFVFCDL